MAAEQVAVSIHNRDVAREAALQVAPEIVWLGDAPAEDKAIVGGKVAPLSRLAARYRVPPGFALTTFAFDLANRDAEAWLRTIMSPMEAQVREHQVQLRRRLESIKRIHQAGDTLEDRMGELKQVQKGMLEQQAQLDRQTDAILRSLTEQGGTTELRAEFA